MTVVGAIDTAGGFTDFAKRSRIQVTRASGKKMTVDYYKALKNPDKDIEIFPGDMIFVPKKLF
jgi:protein involved in polysaccharide export with SLBB domain